jgi:hypothetical protein
MKTQVKGRKLTMDRQHLIKMLSDPDFYDQCPYFLWLKRTALTTYAQYDVTSRNNCCGCGGDFAVMKPVVDAFFTNLKDLKAVDPATIKCVREYLEAKKGYPISLVVIMYRSSRKEPHPQKLKFQF